MNRTWLRRVLVTVTVALLVATAGCSGLLGGDGNENGNGSDGTDGAGYDVAGSDLDGQTVTDATADAVESEGSFSVETTSTATQTQGNEEQTLQSDSSLRVDLENDRGLRNQSQRVESGNGGQEQVTVVYTEGNTSYRKQTVRGETSYDRQEGEPQSFGGIQPINTDEFTQNYTGIVDGFSWEQNGSDEVDGVAVTEYTMTGVADEDALGIGENSTVENASGTLAIDSDGVVRAVTLSYTIDSAQGSVRLDATTTLSNVGSTSVEEPDWLSEAS